MFDHVFFKFHEFLDSDIVPRENFVKKFIGDD